MSATLAERRAAVRRDLKHPPKPVVAEHPAPRPGKLRLARNTAADEPDVDEVSRRDPYRRRQVRQIHRHSGPIPGSVYVIGSIVALLTLVGLVMVLSASSVSLVHDGLSPWAYFVRQLLWAVIGTIALVTTMRVPYQRWRSWVRPALGVSYGLMVLPFIPGIGLSRNGARAWAQIGPIGFQPSEFLKLAVVLYCADLLTKREDRMHLVRSTMVPCLVVLGVSSAFMLAQGDLGSAVVLAAVVLAMVFVGGAPLAPLAGSAAGMAALSMVFVYSKPYRRNRWTAFLDLAKNKTDTAYQVWQALVGISDGGVTGVGFGASRAKWGRLPLAHSDFIFAIVAEELGLIGVVAILGCYLVFAFFGLKIALASADRFGMLIAGGVTAWIAVQAIINVGGVTGMMPLTGLTLPFMSFGGSSLFVVMTAAGLLLSVARSSA